MASLNFPLLKDFVAQNRFAETLELLASAQLPSELETRRIQISGQLAQLRQNRAAGTHSNDELDRAGNQIRRALLELVLDLQNGQDRQELDSLSRTIRQALDQFDALEAENITRRIHVLLDLKAQYMNQASLEDDPRRRRRAELELQSIAEQIQQAKMELKALAQS